MDANKFIEWEELITDSTTDFLSNNAEKFDFWHNLLSIKGNYGGYKQFKNEKWLQSELAFYFSQQFAAKLGKQSWAIIPETRTKGIDYDLFIITDRQNVPPKGPISRIWPYGFGIHLKNWWNSYYKITEFDYLLPDVEKAKKNTATPCIGINLVKKVISDAWRGKINEDNKIKTLKNDFIKEDSYLLIWSFRGN